MKRALDGALIAGFLLLLWVPMYGMYWTREPEPGAEGGATAELRTRHRKPKWSWRPEALAEFPEQFEPWFGDAFGYRGGMLSLRNHLRWYALESSPTDSVLKGKDGWLFATWGDSVETWRGVTPMEDWELEGWRKMLELRRDWLAERGVRYVFTLIPNKNVLYPEHMPDKFRRGRSRREQFLDYMATHSDVVIVDPLPALVRAKEDDRPGDYLYYPLGDHWSDRGAMICYREMLNALAPMMPEHPGVWPWPEEGFLSMPGHDGGDSWAGRMYLQDTLIQESRVLVPDPGRERRARRRTLPTDNQFIQRWRNPHSEAPGCVLFHDSFGPPLVALLGEHFSETVGYWQAEFDADVVEREQPGVVLEAYVERVLSTKTPRIGGPTAQEWLEAEFARCQDLVFEQDFLLDHSGLETRSELDVVSGIDAGFDGAVLHMRSPRGLVYLPEFDIPTDGSGILRIVVSSPRRALLKMSYRTVEDPNYTAARSFGFQLRPGENELYVRLMAPGMTGPLLLRPGSEVGRYVLRSMEVRSGAPYGGEER